MPARPRSARLISKTVHRFQRIAAARAKTHHQQVVDDLAVAGVQLDEAYSKRRPGKVEWIHTALAMESLFIMWVAFGPRTIRTAAYLLAQVLARVRGLPMVLTDGWKAYRAALLQVVGCVYRPRRKGKVGRKPEPRLVAPPALFYAQVVKRRDKAGRLLEVSQRVIFGGPRRFFKVLRQRALGHDDPNGVYGAMVWHLARPGRPLAPPHSLSVVEPPPPSRPHLVDRLALQLGAAP